MLKKQIVHRLLEFFVIGLAMGITEDLIAIALATDAQITPRVFVIATLVAFPFAVISELVVDMEFFKDFVKRKLGE